MNRHHRPNTARQHWPRSNPFSLSPICHTRAILPPPAVTSPTTHWQVPISPCPCPHARMSARHQATSQQLLCPLPPTRSFSERCFLGWRGACVQPLRARARVKTNATTHMHTHTHTDTHAHNIARECKHHSHVLPPCDDSRMESKAKGMLLKPAGGAGAGGTCSSQPASQHRQHACHTPHTHRTPHTTHHTHARVHAFARSAMFRVD